MPKDVTMLNLECLNRDCLLRLRVGRIINKPANIVGGFKYCPLCGGRAASQLDREEDYLETMADAYGVPVEIMKMMLNSWNPNEHNRFSDYVAELQREVDAEMVAV